MNRLLLAAAILSAGLSASAKTDGDPVLMTVDGHDIRVSEFEYLYNKNNNQQLEPQTLDQYLDMFTNYKLKVADAEHAGIQDTPSFVQEFTTFRNELAAPYLIDKDVQEALINESYNHRLADVYVSHIMVPNDDTNRKALDSIRTAILDGKTTFEDEARKWSVDRASKERGGLMGYVSHDRFPWAFEKAAYDTPVGQISPVINSGFGYHIVRPEKRTPAVGEVSASHILRMTRGLDKAEADKQKALIDSLYTLIEGGADFAALASEFSQDPGSARNGGSLGWFGRGAMVAEFDSVAFALADGQISQPFATSFGYHIVKRDDSRKQGALDEETRNEILRKMDSDERGKEPAKAKVAALMKQYNAKLDNAGMERVRSIIDANPGGYDSTAVATLAAMDFAVANYDGGKVTIAQAMAIVPQTAAKSTDNAVDMISGAAYRALENAVVDVAREQLALTNPEYRNLVNEYRDGILLYEISNRNVWEKASKDTEGLEKFFKANASRYKWEAPKFKSYIFFATSDSILNEALQYADSVPTTTPAEFTADLRKKFGRDIKIERVIAAKGENPITDYLGFGEAKPDADGKSRWNTYAAYKGRVIAAPEEAADVRGAAVTDYQAQLEKDWVKSLHKKYKVKVNKKVFEQLKKDSK